MIRRGRSISKPHQPPQPPCKPADILPSGVRKRLQLPKYAKSCSSISHKNGIYVLQNKETDYLYAGRSHNLSNRIAEHQQTILAKKIAKKKTVGKYFKESLSDFQYCMWELPELTTRDMQYFEQHLLEAIGGLGGEKVMNKVNALSMYKFGFIAKVSGPEELSRSCRSPSALIPPHVLKDLVLVLPKGKKRKGGVIKSSLKISGLLLLRSKTTGRVEVEYSTRDIFKHIRDCQHDIKHGRRKLSKYVDDMQYCILELPDDITDRDRRYFKQYLLDALGGVESNEVINTRNAMERKKFAEHGKSDKIKKLTSSHRLKRGRSKRKT